MHFFIFAELITQIIEHKRYYEEKKMSRINLPITSRSARLPEPFDPNIAKTSPP